MELADGTFIPADTVVTGVGVVPATGFLKDSGITLERDGGVKVDEYLRVPGFDGMYAVGDIATYPENSSGEARWTRIEHWNVASNHGRAVGRTISGKGEPFTKVPVFWSAREQHFSPHAILILRISTRGWTLEVCRERHGTRGCYYQGQY